MDGNSPMSSEETIKLFNSSTLGSKWFGYGRSHEDDYLSVAHTPDIWVGEVSWLKASLFEDSDTYIPDSVMEVSKIIGEDFRKIDDKMIEEIERALSLDNTTNYRIASKESITEFLREHYGKKTFTISW